MNVDSTEQVVERAKELEGAIVVLAKTMDEFGRKVRAALVELAAFARAQQAGTYNREPWRRQGKRRGRWVA